GSGIFFSTTPSVPGPAKTAAFMNGHPTSSRDGRTDDSSGTADDATERYRYSRPTECEGHHGYIHHVQQFDGRRTQDLEGTSRTSRRSEQGSRIDGRTRHEPIRGARWLRFRQHHRSTFQRSHGAYRDGTRRARNDQGDDDAGDAGRAVR